MRAGSTRLSLEAPTDPHFSAGLNSTTNAAGTSNASPTWGGLLRFSPPASMPPRFFSNDVDLNETNDNSNGHSINNNNNNNTRQQQQQPSATTATNNATRLPHLQNLATQTSFYASLLYSQTRNLVDALQLARLYCQEQQYTSCLRVLEESRLLQSEQYTWDALLLACQALGAQQDWTALLEIVEDACRIVPQKDGGGGGNDMFRALTVSQPLEDDDTIGWQTLYESIDVVDNGRQDCMHSLALILFWRGKAYHASGNSPRAALYWRLTLKLDCTVAQAWQVLWQTHSITPSEAYTLVSHEMKFETSQEWLKDLYLARIEAISPSASQYTGAVSLDNNSNSNNKSHMNSMSNGNSNNNNNMMNHTIGDHTVDSDMKMMHETSVVPPLHLDQSSIQLSSPIASFSSPSLFNMTTNGFHTLRADAMSRDRGDDNYEVVNADTIGNDIAYADASSHPLQEDVKKAYDRVCKQHGLQDSPQVLALSARRAYRNFQWQKALNCCEAMSKYDPTMGDLAFLYIGTLVLLGRKRVLFRIAHEWVESQPKAAQSWYAVGAYYLACDRYHVAQRHFCRATRLDPHCSEAWLAFGCAFTACDESDQALASFRAAQRLSPGEPSSLLYMGMEYVRTNHLVLAQYFLQAAWKASSGDPLCAHELGVLYLQQKEYEKAQHWFVKALTMAVQDSVSDDLSELLLFCQDAYWEPTIFNLGHAMRKILKFDVATMCFKKCMALRPDEASPISALAFTLHLQGDANAAISLYHQALGIQPDDPFCSEMLQRAYKDYSLDDLLNGPTSAVRSIDVGAKETARSASFVLSPAWTSRKVDQSSMNMSEDMDTSDIDMSST